MSKFPLKIRIANTNEIIVVETINDLPNGIAFVILETNTPIDICDDIKNKKYLKD